MISIIKSKGISVNPILPNPIYLSIFNDIIKQENNMELKKKYRFILWIQLVVVLIFFLFAALLLLNIEF